MNIWYRVQCPNNAACVEFSDIVTGVIVRTTAEPKHIVYMRYDELAALIADAKAGNLDHLVKEVPGRKEERETGPVGDETPGDGVSYL